MKILLYSGGRTGSQSLGRWICNELNYYFIHEENSEFDYKNSVDFVYKRNLHDKDFIFENERDFFDKIIILYRENTLDQAVSGVHALIKQQWHHEEGKDAFYEISENFYEENYDTILIWKKDFDNELERIRQYENVLLISYEDIFEKNIGQKQIEDYLNITSKTILTDPNNKLRKENLKSTLEFYRKYTIDLENKLNQTTNILKSKELLLIKQNKDFKNEKTSLNKQIKFCEYEKNLLQVQINKKNLL